MVETADVIDDWAGTADTCGVEVRNPDAVGDMVEVAATDECLIEAADVIDDGAEATVSSGDEVRAPELEE